VPAALSGRTAVPALRMALAPLVAVVESAPLVVAAVFVRMIAPEPVVAPALRMALALLVVVVVPEPQMALAPAAVSERAAVPAPDGVAGRKTAGGRLAEIVPGKNPCPSG
jgi:hypothetical protein